MMRYTMLCCYVILVCYVIFPCDLLCYDIYALLHCYSMLCCVAMFPFLARSCVMLSYYVIWSIMLLFTFCLCCTLLYVMFWYLLVMLRYVSLCYLLVGLAWAATFSYVCFRWGQPHDSHSFTRWRRVHNWIYRSARPKCKHHSLNINLSDV